MKKLSKSPHKGLVVMLPDCTEIGVVLHAHQLRKDLFLGTILGSDACVYIAKFKIKSLELGFPIEYVDYECYDIDNALETLKTPIAPEIPEISEEELEEFKKDIPENEEKMIALAIHHSHICEEYDLDPEDLSFERNIELYLLHKKTGLWIL